MTEPVRIEPGGYLLIDTTAWVRARTHGPLPDLTHDLHDWTRTPSATNPQPSAGERKEPERWQAAALAWCTARGHQPGEAGVIEHAQSRLDAAVWILPAITADSRRIVVVGVNHDPPTVHADTTPDPWWWCDPDSVVITCPGGHSWLWRSGRELLTKTGQATTLTLVFGPNLDAPFSLCPDCTAYQLGSRKTPCGCDATPWIVCPTCAQRCSLHLPRP